MQIKKLAIKCLAIIASMSVLVGCGQAKTDEEIEKENEVARKSVDEHIKNSGNIKSNGTVIAKKIGGSADPGYPGKRHFRMRQALCRQFSGAAPHDQ